MAGGSLERAHQRLGERFPDSRLIIFLLPDGEKKREKGTLLMATLSVPDPLSTKALSYRVFTGAREE